ncbi:MAG: sodium:proton exchanger [Kofleriaceae bacterium]|nr:sodium:proton exchanger [Kofleriaceae bacterium]
MIEILILLAITGLMQTAQTFGGPATTGATELGFGYLLLAAYFFGRLGSRLKLPKLTGYLLAGVFAGPYVLGLITHDMASSLRIVNGVATCVLGLTAGGELDLARVKPLLRTLRSITFYGIFVAMLILTGILFLLRPMLPMFDEMTFVQSIAVCGVIAVALSAQSPSVVMALLAETRAEGPLSRLVLATVVVADLVVIIIYSIVAAIAGSLFGGSIDVTATTLEIAWELLGSMAFGIAIGVLIGAFLRSVRGGSATLFALMVCVVVAEIGARIHLDPLVVMMTAGLWLRNFSKSDANALLHNFESAELPVFLVFFALAGSKLDLYMLWTTAIPVAIIAAVRAGVFYAGCRFACVRTHADPSVTRFGWTGLVPQAGLSLALVVVIQKNFPSFGQPAAVLLLSVVGVNQLIAPVLLRMSLVRSGEAGRRAPRNFATEH